VSDQVREQLKGIIFVVSAPSGAGKTTLCAELSKRVANLTRSISYTTRAPRPGERHGED
jgi:guanylate kinase